MKLGDFNYTQKNKNSGFSQSKNKCFDDPDNHYHFAIVIIFLSFPRYLEIHSNSTAIKCKNKEK
jgi:hypothetical protein